jgi:hypothetical protein
VVLVGYFVGVYEESGEFLFLGLDGILDGSEPVFVWGIDQQCICRFRANDVISPASRILNF